MTELKRTLGLGSLTFYGVGIILGAGIYSIIGAAAGEAGDALWLSFAIAATVALLCALSYAELATMFPAAGAEYTYLRKAMPKLVWARRMVGLLLVGAGVATASTVATAFAGYFSAFVAMPPLVVAATLLLLMSLLNVVGLKQSSWANIAMTSVEAAGLVLVVIAGAMHPDFANEFISGITPGVFTGAGLVFFAYLGFEDIANLAEETKEPERTLPRAIFISLLVSTVLYVLVALAAVAMLPAERLAESERPLADAIHEQWPRASGALGGIALFATANTALIALIASSRLVYGMARGGDLPSQLTKVLPKRNTPWVAAIIVLVLALLLLPLRDAASLGGIASFAALIAFACVNLCVIVLRRTKPRAERPFRVPFCIRDVPVLPVLGILGALGLAITLPPIAYLSGLAVLALLAIVELVRWLAQKKR